MAVKKKTATTKTTKSEAVEKSTASVVSEPTAVAVTSASSRKYPSTVTVCLNFPSSIEFDVIDSHGVSRSVVINGNATHLAGLDHGVLPKAGSYGMTFGIDGELWEAVEKKHHDSPLFKNGLIFATATKTDAEEEVKKMQSSRNGLEPIDPDKPI